VKLVEVINGWPEWTMEMANGNNFKQKFKESWVKDEVKFYTT